MERFMPATPDTQATPGVSVIIPAYNQAGYLGQAIRSVLEQTYHDVEVIVVDDGSTDSTRQVAQGFTDTRLRYVYQENAGLSAARNTGILHARGRYVSYLDSDDFFLPHKLDVLTDTLEREPTLGMAAGQAVPVDDTGTPVGRVFDRPLPEIPANWLLGNPLHVGSVLLRQEWQERVGFFDTRLRSYEDWDLWLRLARAGCTIRLIARPVSAYRFHGAQMTRQAEQMTQASFAVLDKTFADPDLPWDWTIMRKGAYSRAHLRGAAQAYLTGQFEDGAWHLRHAICLEPALASQNGAALAQHFAAWTDLPKTGDSLSFLASIYDHLPDELDGLRARRGQELARVAMHTAFEAFARGDMRTARVAVRRAVRYSPTWLGNRGVVSVLLRSHLSMRLPGSGHAPRPEAESRYV